VLLNMHTWHDNKMW